MARMSIEFDGLEQMLEKLNKVEGLAEKTAEDALKKTHEIVTAKAEAATHQYPAGGHYSKGKTAASLRKSAKITWSGTEASVQVGFNIKRGGLPSIFMMYGTPRYMKVQAMYDAFYGSATEAEVRLAQKEIFNKALEELE